MIKLRERLNLFNRDSFLDLFVIKGCISFGFWNSKKQLQTQYHEQQLQQKKRKPLKYFNIRISPVPELSFLPAIYRGRTRVGERRVQDNLHAHAQNAAIISPQIGGKTIFGSIFQIWLVARFSD